MQMRIFLISLSLALLAAPLSAQLGLPQVNLPPTGTVVDPVTGQISETLDNLSSQALRQAERLADLRERNLRRLVRRNRDVMEFDARGEPARRGQLLLIDAGPVAMNMAEQLGFTIGENAEIAGLEIMVTRLSVPHGMELAAAERLLKQALPDAQITADNLHFTSGVAEMLPQMAASASSATISVPVGVIDGGARHSAAIGTQRGFASGAPYPSDHGTSVASLLEYAGVRKIQIADVYGLDKAGGNALAIARAMGWLVQSGNKIINISLVGPENALVEKAVKQAQAKGVHIVAPVGNDGPAAPPSYPASYDGVLAITAVDRKNRPLIEVGRALHLDYAAPGADIYGDGAKGQRVKLRGTSFASPLVAARLAAALQSGGNWRARLDREARDLGKKGIDAAYGRGLLCGACRPEK